MIVATANVKASLADPRSWTAVNRVLHRQPQLLMLQEWGRGRHDVLDRLDSRWGTAGRRRPIVYDRNTLLFEETFLAELENGGRVKRLRGRRRELGDTVARVLIARRRWDGRFVIGINFHLPAAVDRNGRPRRSSGWQRLAQHAEATAGLGLLWRAYGEMPGVEVYAGGDTNVDHRDDRRVEHKRFPHAVMTRVGAVSCWEGNMPDRPRNGTHGRRLIDNIYAPQRARRVLQLGIPGDHDAVVAHYDGTTP